DEREPLLAEGDADALEVLHRAVGANVAEQVAAPLEAGLAHAPVGVGQGLLVLGLRGGGVDGGAAAVAAASAARLGVGGGAGDGSAALNPARVPGDDVEAVLEGGREGAQLGRQVADAGVARAAGVDEQRPDA